MPENVPGSSAWMAVPFAEIYKLEGGQDLGERGIGNGDSWPW